MEKIVLLTNPSEENEILIGCLRRLFPECEIRVKLKETENLDEFNCRRSIIVE